MKYGIVVMVLPGRTQFLKETLFPKTLFHTTTVFENKTWILGGKGIESGSVKEFNDVWYLD